MLVFGASHQHFGRDRLKFCQAFAANQPKGRKEPTADGASLLDANKKEFEAHDTVNESKATIKCLRIVNLPGLVPHKAGNE
jgi:hypothetical protein